jgi:hypothetical protein
VQGNWDYRCAAWLHIAVDLATVREGAERQC